MAGTQLIQLYKFVRTIPSQNSNINLHSELQLNLEVKVEICITISYYYKLIETTYLPIS